METYLQFRERILDKDWYFETRYLVEINRRPVSDVIQLDNRSFIIGGDYGYKNEFYNTFYEVDGDNFIYIAAGVRLIGAMLKEYLNAYPSIKNELLEFYDKNNGPYGSSRLLLL